MPPSLSVLLPTYNPHRARLDRTLAALAAQTVPPRDWELVIVDNASTPPVALDVAWHPHARIVREPKLGLTHARLAAGAAATAALYVMVDDDNVLAPDYLAHCLGIFADDPALGAIGGRSTPEWEVEPPGWMAEFLPNLALRDLGGQAIVAAPSVPPAYPPCAPIGAGMGIRAACFAAYASAVAAARQPIVDRQGQSLTSGGDNDIVLHTLAAGFKVGYFPQLGLRHLIPASRVTAEYLARLNEGIAASWVQVLDRHGIRPWSPIAPWTVPVRKWRAYLRLAAWRNEAAYVRWRGACGTFTGRARLRRAS